MKADFTPQHGVGTYTAPDGSVVKHSDLPDDVKSEVQRLGSLQHLARQGGYNGQVNQYQKKINRLYDPRTRQGDMETVNIQRRLETRLNGKNL